MPATSKDVSFHTVDLGGTKVNFPFEPYDLQIAYMKKVLECVRESKNGLLESPTGTGKTLSLLCSSLAWLEHTKAQGQMARLQAAANTDPGAIPADTDCFGMMGPRHKIIYSSRTHSQLSQAVAELAGTTYRYMKVAILGSRDQLCVNPAVMEASSSREKLHMCQARVKVKSCVFHQNVEKNKDRSEFRDSEVLDIEDLHKLGKKHSFCPYYMSRELYKTADVIFLPYNYLLDEKTRKTLDLDLGGAVIIFDEAHNINKLCEETASVSLTLADIALAIQDINAISDDVGEPTTSFDDPNGGGGVGAKDLNESEMLAIKGFLLDIETRLGELMKDKKSLTKTGTFIEELFGQFRLGSVQHMLDLMVNHASSSNEGGPSMSTKGRGLTKISDLVSAAFNPNVRSEDLETVFKVHLNKEEKSEGGRGFLKSRSETVTLNLWCFSPGFSMQRLAKLGARSIILTSGTLSPLSAFQEEIGLPFPVQLENKHIITASQVWCGVLSAGPDGTVLNSSFRCRSDPKYLSSLGQSIINIIRVVPHGVLVFFPSYSLMNSTREFWQNNGLWSKIEAIKPIFQEPQRKDALSATMKEYYAAAKEVRGACFLAVCRGKVAEGLDFADDNGRAVLIMGLPYPPLKDARVELKRQFLDDEMKKAGKSSLQGMTGSKWYSLEAFRATNQAIGRVIRHSRDHGAIIFLDNRFADKTAREALSRWLQPFFQTHKQIGTAIKGIASFFKTDSLIGKQRGEIIAEQTALINRGKGTKRQRIEVELESTAATQDIEAADYKLAVGAVSGNTASSIFSTSSQGIYFGGAQPKADNEPVFRVPTPVNEFAQQQQQKRKKLKIVARGFPSRAAGADEGSAADENKPENKQTPRPSASKEPSPSETKVGVSDSKEVAKKYVSFLKKTVSNDEFTFFKTAIKYYKRLGDLEDVKTALDTILVKYLVRKPELLTGFKVFIKKNHVEEFDKFCDLTLSLAKDVEQSPSPTKLNKS